MCPQRIVGWQGLASGDVEHRPAELAPVERRHQRRLVDQRAPRHVHQQRARLGRGQEPLVDEMVRLGRRRRRHHDDVGPAHGAEVPGGHDFVDRLGARGMAAHADQRDTEG
jgi:hypothetical protein